MPPEHRIAKKHPEEADATAAKKMHPVGVCKTCGGITYRKETINQRCGRSPNGHRCHGIFANASRAVDWKECVTCRGTGKTGGQPCLHCRGIGWSLAKPWIL
jgi:DnaJ-class molecular chaperone